MQDQHSPTGERTVPFAARLQALVDAVRLMPNPWVVGIGWLLALSLIVAGLWMVFPMPNARAARAIVFEPKILERMKLLDAKDALLPGGAAIPPGRGATIVCANYVMAFAGQRYLSEETLVYDVSDIAPDGTRDVAFRLTTVNRGAERDRFERMVLGHGGTATIDGEGNLVRFASADPGNPWSAFVAAQALAFEPGGLLPARELRPGDTWTRDIESRDLGIPGASLGYKATLVYEGLVRWHSARMAYVSGTVEGQHSGIFLPDDEDGDTGTRIEMRTLTAKVHYFFDPETGEFLGGLHRETTVQEKRMRRVRSGPQDEIQEFGPRTIEYVVQTNINADVD
ncbi:MAG: hypothetical protein PWP23_1774 [Candidatus Sumerlaeota bacterium]|nr:hypothetical protein [Candidatus Sumerlaeota bacterium]